MKCRKCGFEYADGLSECPKCGSPSGSGVRICSVCGSTMPENASFCRICGSDGAHAQAKGISFEGKPLCPGCGRPLPDGAARCPECGTRTAGAKPAVAGKPYGIRTRIKRIPFFFRLLAVLAVIVSLAVTAVLAAVYIRGGRAASNAIALALDTSLVGAYDGENGQFVFAEPRGSSFRVDCPGLYSFLSTPDRSVWLLVSGADDGKAVVTRVTRDGAEEITRSAWPDNISLSSSGTGVAFLTGVTEGSGGTLRLWHPGDGKPARLAEDVLPDSPVVISPDGESAAWVGSYASDGSFSAYVSDSGRTPALLGEDMKPFAVSDSAKLIYYIKDGRVFVRSRSGDTELADNVGYSSLSEYHMSSDLRQVMYNSRGSVCISTDGQPGRQVAQAWLSGAVLPGSAQAAAAENGVRLITYPMSTFRGAVLKLDGGLYYYGGEAGILRIADSFDHAFLSQNGLSITWENDGLIYRISDLRRSDKFSPAPYYDAGHTTSVAADARRVYLCSDSEIISVGRSGAHTVIARAPDAALIGAVNGRLYFTRDDALYSVRRGTKPKLVTSGRVMWARMISGGLLVKMADGSLYITPEGKTTVLY